MPEPTKGSLLFKFSTRILYVFPTSRMCCMCYPSNHFWCVCTDTIWWIMQIRSFFFLVSLTFLWLLLSVWVYHALMLHTGMYSLPRVERLDWALYSMWLDLMNRWPYFILCHCYTACNWNKWKIKLLTSNIKPN